LVVWQDFCAGGVDFEGVGYGEENREGEGGGVGAEGGPSLSKEGEEGEPEREEAEAEAKAGAVAANTKRLAISVAAVFSSNDNVLVVDGEDGINVVNVGSEISFCRFTRFRTARVGALVSFFFRRTRMFELGLRSCKGNMISKFMPPSIVLQGVVAIWDRVRVPSFTSGEENENCKLFWMWPGSKKTFTPFPYQARSRKLKQLTS